MENYGSILREIKRKNEQIRKELKSKVYKAGIKKYGVQRDLESESEYTDQQDMEEEDLWKHYHKRLKESIITEIVIDGVKHKVTDLLDKEKELREKLGYKTLEFDSEEKKLEYLERKLNRVLTLNKELDNNLGKNILVSNLVVKELKKDLLRVNKEYTDYNKLSTTDKIKYEIDYKRKRLIYKYKYGKVDEDLYNSSGLIKDKIDSMIEELKVTGKGKNLDRKAIKELKFDLKELNEVPFDLKFYSGVQIEKELKTAKLVIEKVFEKLKYFVVKTGKKVDMPYNLGYLQAIQYKVKETGVNYKVLKEQGVVVPHNNLSTRGYWCIVDYRNRKERGLYSYVFSLARQNNRVSSGISKLFDKSSITINILKTRMIELSIVDNELKNELDSEKDNKVELINEVLKHCQVRLNELYNERDSITNYINEIRIRGESGNDIPLYDYYRLYGKDIYVRKNKNK